MSNPPIPPQENGSAGGTPVPPPPAPESAPGASATPSAPPTPPADSGAPAQAAPTYNPNDERTRTASMARRPFSSMELDNPTAEVLLRIYNKKRLDGQLNYYRARVQEFDLNADFMLSISAIIMAISTVVSAVGATTTSAPLALVTAILPALAALVSSFRQLYQWEKQSTLYRDAGLGLQEASLILPDDDVFDKRTSQVFLPRVVSATEAVFMAEINQWGQIALGLDEEEKSSIDDDIRALGLTEGEEEFASGQTGSIRIPGAGGGTPGSGD